MAVTNKIVRIKELISAISEADKKYYGEDNPSISDREYDALVDELLALEKETGIAFANSPTKRVGGSNKTGLEQVRHTKQMLSAKKTKSVDDIIRFAGNNEIILSWKLDGLTLVLRYSGGQLRQAITRGENGLVGEDVTDNVKHMRNVPKKVKCKDDFEVRGEGVMSWTDFSIVSRNGSQGHPRNTAAGAVRALSPDKGVLSHTEFFAFELIYPHDKSKTKQEQFDFLALNGFICVEYNRVSGCVGEKVIREAIDAFNPEGYPYPVDGIIAEYNDIAFGRSLGATAHHENRMLALKWEDGLYETTFRGVELSVTRSGAVALIALFDPVNIDGAQVRRADLHSLSNFERYKFGIGDTIKVYKANMIIPQVAKNITSSGTYSLPELCPCCGSKLEIKASASGVKNLYCPNEECIAKNAQRIARFCDKDAMNIDGCTATMLEKLMAYGFVKTFADLYHLKEKRAQLLTTPGFGFESCDKLIKEAENSRRCRLHQFLVAVGIPLMGPNNAREISEYFNGSWNEFEKAVKEEFCFFHISGVSQALSKNIIKWYNDESQQRLWKPLLKELIFIDTDSQCYEGDNAFAGKNVVVTGTVNGMSRQEITELLKLLGAIPSDSVSGKTSYLIVGEAPGTKKLSAALAGGVKIITEGQFIKMLSE